MRVRGISRPAWHLKRCLTTQAGEISPDREITRPRVQAVAEPGKMRGFLCPRGDLNTQARDISPVRGNIHEPSITAGACGRQEFRVPCAARVGRRAKSVWDRSLGRCFALDAVSRLAVGRVFPEQAGHRPVLAAAYRGRIQRPRSRSALPAEPGRRNIRRYARLSV